MCAAYFCTCVIAVAIALRLRPGLRRRRGQAENEKENETEAEIEGGGDSLGASLHSAIDTSEERADQPLHFLNVWQGGLSVCRLCWMLRLMSTCAIRFSRAWMMRLACVFL